MKKQRKKVKVSCHGPISLGNQYKSPWEDVWIRYKIKPGKSHQFWFTFISYPSFQSDIELNNQCSKENPDLDFSNESKYYEDILEHLKSNDFYFNREAGDIISKAKYIDRDLVEKLLDWYMKTKGYTNVKYYWKRPDILVQPVCFSNYKEDEEDGI
jgi:hypothetical protein